MDSAAFSIFQGYIIGYYELYSHMIIMGFAAGMFGGVMIELSSNILRETKRKKT